MAEDNENFSDTLLPALIKCFGIMFFGYILGRSKILGQKEAAGLSKFVIYLALPSLIFVRLSTLSFENVNWSFIASIFVGKTVIFCCVALLTLVLTHPANLGKAGIFAITTTMSNDFALGYPLFLSLYRNSHPDYPGYLYIIAPAQLLIFNLAGFMIMEIQLNQNGQNNGKCLFFKVIKSTVSNPIVVMTIVGMVWNISFSQIPPIFKATLDTLSEAFPATALLLVGHTMGIKSEKSDTHIPIKVALLIIAKNLISPIIMQKFGSLMIQSHNRTEIESLSSFGFLYGTTPTAPSVYVFANQYNIAVEAITKTVVGSTLLSAPLMFASASVISLMSVGTQVVSNYLALTISYLSCASFVCCSWILIFYFIGKRFQHIRFGVTFYIIFSQLLTSVGGISLFLKIKPFSTIFYAQYILSIGGIIATRIGTLFLAVLVVVLRKRSLCFILQARKHINVISISCMIISFVIVACLLCDKNAHPEGPNHQLGHTQTIAVFTVTLTCFIGTILCLVLQHICFRKLQSRGSIEASTTGIEHSDVPILPQVTVTEHDSAVLTLSEEVYVDVEDLDRRFASTSINSDSWGSSDIENSFCDSRHQCSRDRRQQCAMKIAEYRKNDMRGLYDDTEIFQHIFLIIGMCVAMTVSLAVCIWKLTMEIVNGIFFELEFLDVIMNYNLGILFFFIFGFDTKAFHAFSSKCKLLWCGYKRDLVKASSSDICQGFLMKHKEKFKTDNRKSKHLFCKEYHSLFSSSDLIKWLIDNEGVSDAQNAKLYISYLLEGQIIEKENKFELFPDNLSIYKFKN